MKVQWAVVCSCIAIAAVHTGAKAAEPDKAPASVESATSAPPLKLESAFSDYQPFRDEKLRSWKEANQVVADNPGMGSMSAMKGMTGMDAQPANAPDGKEGSRGHDVAAMKAMPGMAMESDKATVGSAGAPAHDMGAMKGMPGMKTQAGAAQHAHSASVLNGKSSMHGMTEKSMPGSKEPAHKPMQQGHGEMAMAKLPAAVARPDSAPASAVSGTGTVQGVDKANSRVKLAHDPIAALGWPKMTMFFRLKDGALADRIKEGDRIEFALEKSATGYLISDLKKRTPGH